MALLALAVIFGVDLVFQNVQPALPVAALMDESAHAGTALLLAGLLPRRLTSMIVAMLAVSVLIDVDHLPLLLGTDALTAGTGRPYPHALASVLVLLLVAIVCRGRWRPIVLGATLGLGAHLFRDAATGGVPLFWPLSRMTVQIPYVWYAATLLGVAGWTCRRWWSERPAHADRAMASRRTPSWTSGTDG